MHSEHRLPLRAVRVFPDSTITPTPLQYRRFDSVLIHMPRLTRRPVVLLVQPAHDDRDMYAEYLRLNHFNVLCFDDAASGAAAAEGADTIVTEIRLPGTDGIEFMRRLRDGAATKHL